MVLRRDIQDERDRLSVRAGDCRFRRLWRTTTVLPISISSRTISPERSCPRWIIGSLTSGSITTTRSSITAPRCSAASSASAPARASLWRRSSFLLWSSTWLGSSSLFSACGSAGNSSRWWRLPSAGNGTLAAPACDQVGAFRRLPELRLCRRRLDLQFALPRLFRQLVASATWQAVFSEVPHIQCGCRLRPSVLSICDRRLSRGAVGLSAAVPGAHHHGGHPALVESRSHAARIRSWSHGAARALLPRGCFHSRRRWSVPGRCGTGAIRAIGICSHPLPARRPACCCFCRFLPA